MHAEAMPEADRTTLADPAAVADRIVDIVRHAEQIPSGARLEAASWRPRRWGRRLDPRRGAHGARPPPPAPGSALGRAARPPRARPAAPRPRRATSSWSTTPPRCPRRSRGAPPTDRSWRSGWRARTRTRRGPRSFSGPATGASARRTGRRRPRCAVGTPHRLRSRPGRPRHRGVGPLAAARHPGLWLRGLHVVVGALSARDGRCSTRTCARALALWDVQPFFASRPWAVRAGIRGPRLERPGDGRPARRRGHRSRA